MIPTEADIAIAHVAAHAHVRSQHPRFWDALIADAELTAKHRWERSAFHSKADALAQALRLMWVSDAFLGQSLYRFKARMQALGIPILPLLAHRLAMMTAQVCIGDPVIMRTGVYLAHGQVVIDGFVEIDSGTAIYPWVTIGIQSGGNFQGPVIGRDVRIGTGAKILGPIKVGAGAQIGANAVVLNNVGAATTVVGVPAREIPERDLPADG